MLLSRAFATALGLLETEKTKGPVSSDPFENISIFADLD